MTTNCAPTARASPPLRLRLKKFLHPLLLDELQVLNHTHLVPCLVASVESFQCMAGKVSAFKAENYFTFQQFGAAFFDEGALLVSGAATCAGGYTESFGVYVVLESLIACAESTVHAARRH
jgi:hypothetical protein